MENHGVIRFRLLGAPAIDGPASNGQAVLKQPKRLALLAYLAGRGGFVARDTVLGLFWPEMAEDRARSALSQSIHFLRSELGRRSILTRGAELSVGGIVRSDVGEFELAVRNHEWEAALTLYGGEFLAGLTPPRAREAGVWLDGERSRLRRLATTAAAALSDAAYRRGDLQEAVRWMQRGLEIDPFDEVGHRTLLALLDEAGNGAAALTVHEAFRARLRETFGSEPSPETCRIVGLIRLRKSEAAVPGAVAPAPPEPSPAAAPAAAEAGPVRRGPRRWRSPKAMLRNPWARILVGSDVALFAAVVVLAGLLVRSRAEGRDPPPVSGRVAVLYFDVTSGDPDLRHVADGLTEAIIGQAGRAGHIDVVSANGVMPFREQPVSIDSVTARLHAETVITGRLARSDGTTRLMLQVIDAATQKQIRGVPTLQTERTDLLGVLDDLTTQFAENLSPILGDLVIAGRWRAGTRDDRAFDGVLRGAQAIKLLDRQIRDGDFEGAGYTFNAADSTLLTAAERDPGWAEPHVLLADLDRAMAFRCMIADCQSEVNDWLDRATRHANDALAVHPSDAAALEMRGRATYERFAWDAGDGLPMLDRADADLRTAITIDPTRAGAMAALSAVLFSKGEFDSAERLAKDALEQDAFLEDRVEIQNRLFLSAFHSGHDQEATSWCDAVRAYQRGRWMGAQCALNLMAWARDARPDPAEARRVIRNALMHEPASIVQYYGPRLEMAMAAVFARARMTDSAHAAIARAVTTSPDDPELLDLEAAARTALREFPRAALLLEQYTSASPNREHVTAFRWFDNPALRPLVEFQVGSR